ncbi:hypothetical protein XELAEV_18047226mg [Xenopus laevis]|uniref:Ig-like domain-containing protein n=1 Tax=Xenopus laevis TaxID=8355 RepID=A0A974H1C2_XENLA|nr:hypothetical protein XELAEV_18047226mg [Xenopus laevis]
MLLIAVYTDITSPCVLSSEEESTESYRSNLLLANKTKTLESMPESAVYSNKLEFKLEASKPDFVKQLAPQVLQIYIDDNEFSCIIPHVQIDKEEEYTYIAINDHGEARCSSYLTVGPKQFLEVTQTNIEKPKILSTSTDGSFLCAPSFVHPLEPVRCAQSHPAIFKYIITGNPKSKNQWCKGENHIFSNKQYSFSLNQNEEGTFIIHKSQLEDCGSYTSPVLRTKIESLEAAVGHSAVFTCETEPAPNLSFQWFKSGREIYESDKYSVKTFNYVSTLEVLKAQVVDCGDYSCKASNQFGSISSSASLTVTEALPPSFVTRPESVTSFVSKKAKFQATVSGTPVIDAIWKKDGFAISSSENLHITAANNKHVLELLNLSISDKGIYSCKASNKFGTDTCQAELIVIDKPHFIKELGPICSAVNKTICLECQVDEDRKVTVVWMKGDHKLLPGKDYRIYFEDKVASLEIPVAKIKDSGNYMCTATNDAGSSSTFSSVICRVSGTGPFDASWFKDKKQIQSSKKYRLILQRSLVFLEISSFNSADVGNYVCVVVNEVGKCICSAPYQLKDPPSFVKKTENITSIVGSNVSMQAVLTGSEVITVSWMKGKDVVQEDDKIKITYDNNVATLYISNIQLSSSGKYTCVAENDAGSQNCFVELIVKGTLELKVKWLRKEK